jgi:hypothetical protein
LVGSTDRRHAKFSERSCQSRLVYNNLEKVLAEGTLAHRALYRQLSRVMQGPISIYDIC